ncbi:MAG: hypothetical protein GX663_00875 [Clostridiales bacterium]|nr:hypothetical protein [Clostridiales bacterium]
MNHSGYKYCCTKKKKKRKNEYKKMGLIMLLLGAVTICAFLLPIRYWIVVLGLVLVIFGILLIKK